MGPRLREDDQGEVFERLTRSEVLALLGEPRRATVTESQHEPADHKRRIRLRGSAQKGRASKGNCHADVAGRMTMLAAIKRSNAYLEYKERKKALVRRLMLPRFRGSAHECPVCDTQLRAFKPLWKSYPRQAAQYGYIHPLTSLETFNIAAFSCPACDATDRERLYALFFDREFRTFDHSRRHRFIEFGPGNALQKKLRSYPFLEYRSADLYFRNVDDRIDITDMRAYGDQSVEAFLCSHVLEHVREDRQAMRELYRVLKPCGVGVVMVPLVHGVEATEEDPAVNTPELQWKYYGMADHVRQYGRSDFVARLRAAGFDIERFGIDHFGAETFRRAGLARDSMLYVVRKPAAAPRSASATGPAR
jgi:SAM-dependent methyltransferase